MYARVRQNHEAILDTMYVMHGELGSRDALTGI